MKEREVKASGKDKDGDITSLCNSGEYWSPRKKKDAINDIELNLCTYYVFVNYQKARVLVKDRINGKYLTTSPDGTTKNNLDNLPDC